MPILMSMFSIKSRIEGKRKKGNGRKGNGIKENGRMGNQNEVEKGNGII